VKRSERSNWRKRPRRRVTVRIIRMSRLVGWKVDMARSDEGDERSESIKALRGGEGRVGSCEDEEGF